MWWFMLKREKHQCISGLSIETKLLIEKAKYDSIVDKSIQNKKIKNGGIISC